MLHLETAFKAADVTPSLNSAALATFVKTDSLKRSDRFKGPYVNGLALVAKLVFANHVLLPPSSSQS